MITCYIIQKPVHRPGMNVLLEFDAADEAEARTTFTRYVGTMLVEDPNFNCRFVSFERWLGGWIDGSLVRATAEDLLDRRPDWFTDTGFYDESDNLILAASETIDRITYQDYSYFVTNLKPEGSKEWQRRSIK
jgi:hypothetical protein